jgi:trehalose-6-phosphatase
MVAPVVVVGARTAGAYFAPLVSAFLSRRGWPRCSWLTIRPKNGLSRHERRQLRTLGRHDAHVVLVDDYPNSGVTFGLMVDALRHSGIDPARITVLMPSHSVRLGWRPESDADWAAGLTFLRLEPVDLHKARLLSPEAMEPLFAEYFGDFDAVRVEASASVDAINTRFTRQCHDGFQVRMKRVFDVQLARHGEERASRHVVAKSVGWGWLGYHAYIIGTRLAGEVPSVIGLRNGLLLSAWIGGLSLAGADAASGVSPSRLGSYVARRARQLRLSGDPCFDNPGYRWTGWDEIVGILRGIYGPYVGRLKDRALRESLRPLITPMPTVVDGRMRELEWIRAPEGVYKVDAEHHNFGGGELDVVDAAYDLAAAFFEHSLSEAQQQEALAAYASDSGDPRVADRILLYELLYGVVTMRAAAEAATRAGRSPQRENANQRYLRARTALTDRMSRFNAGLSGERSAPQWTRRLFFLDLDGVFDHEHLGFPHTTPSGIAAIDLLKAHAFSVVLNTGRSVDDVRRYCSIYGLPGGLAEHGSVFVDAVRQCDLSLIDADGAAQIMRSREAIAGIPGACIDPAYTHSIRTYRYAGRRTDHVSASDVGTMLARAGCDRLECLVRDADSYIVQKGTGKAAGIRAVRQYLGCADQPAAAIGDSDLDVEALESVELAFAPANCAPIVRALARHGGCRVMRQPLQRGLLAAARDVVRRAPGQGAVDVRWARQRCTAATELLLTLLAAADRPRSRQWLAACNWRTL